MRDKPPHEPGNKPRYKPLRELLHTCCRTMSHTSQAEDNNQGEDSRVGPGHINMEMDLPGYNIRWLVRNRKGFK